MKKSETKLITAKVRKAVGRHYGLGRDATDEEAMAEIDNLARRREKGTTGLTEERLGMALALAGWQDE
jgi:hypothetical protein